MSTKPQYIPSMQHKTCPIFLTTPVPRPSTEFPPQPSQNPHQQKMQLQLLILSVFTALTLADPKKKKPKSTSTPCTKDCTLIALSPGTDCARITPLPKVGELYCLDQTHYVTCQPGFGHQYADLAAYGDMCWTGSWKVKTGPGVLTHVDIVLPGQTGQEPGYTPPPTARR